MKKTVIIFVLTLLVLPSLTSAVSVEQDKFISEGGESFSWNVSLNYNVTEDDVAVFSDDQIDLEDLEIEDDTRITTSHEIDDSVESGVYTVGLLINRSVISMGGSSIPVTETIFTSIGIGLTEKQEFLELVYDFNSARNEMSSNISKLVNRTEVFNRSLQNMESDITDQLQDKEDRISELEEEIEKMKGNITDLKETTEETNVGTTGNIVERGSVVGGILILVSVGAYLLYRRNKTEDEQEFSFSFGE